MEKKLSAWCKNAKIEMINRDLKTTTLAKELDMNRSYVSSILNGRVYSAPAVKKISDYLGIADSDTTTVYRMRMNTGSGDVKSTREFQRTGNRNQSGRS